MKNFFKLLALVLVVAMTAVFFVACGDKPDPQPQPGPGNTDTPAVSAVDTDITDAALKNIVGSGNLYVTAIGQSATSTVKNLLKQAGWYVAEEAEGKAGAKIYTISNTLTASQVQAGDTVIIILGTSGKGLGSAGVSQADELARAQGFTSAANINIIAIHTGKKEYRGESSDPIISEVAANANVCLVVDAEDGQGGNYDGLFTSVCGTQVPLYTFSKAANMSKSIQHLVKA